MKRRKPPILWTLFRIWLVWRDRPWLRLGQLLENAVNNDGQYSRPLFYVRDEDLVAHVRERFQD